MEKIPAYVREILQRLEQGGHEAFCVGGCVRDTLMGRVPGDWDVTTSALPEETMALFDGHAIPTGLQHGTVTVRSQHQSVEVTTFRRDGDYTDHRHPDHVIFTSSLEEDLSRRDFTVNAMAMDLRGRIYDPFGGQADLRAKLLRCVGEPERRFHEDALRILRGLRFSSVLGFAIEEKTGESLYACRGLLGEIAAERIQVELTKLLCGEDAAQVLRRWPDVIGVVVPEILPMVGFDQRNPHHCYDVWEHTLHALSATRPDAVLRYAVLFHDIGKPESYLPDEWGVGHFKGHPLVSRRISEEIMHRLRFDNATRERIAKLVEWHDYRVKTEKGVRRLLNRLGEADVRLLLEIQRADNFGQAEEYRYRQKDIDQVEQMLDREIEKGSCFSLRQLAVNGRDMMVLGLRGPEIGQTLDFLLGQVIDGALPNEKEILLETAKNRMA